MVLNKWYQTWPAEAIYPETNRDLELVRK